MLLLTFVVTAAAAPDGKTVAVDDWHAVAITQVGGSTSGPLYLQVHAGDLDGDGVADDAVLKLVCAAGKLANASYVVMPRDSGSGMATGKRQHKPVTFVKEWGAASPQLSAIKPTYNIKELKGNEKRTSSDGWQMLSLANTDGLCPAAEAAAATVVKSKSNITNN